MRITLLTNRANPGRRTWLNGWFRCSLSPRPAACALLTKTRTTDSPSAARSGVPLSRAVPRPAACALLVISVWATVALLGEEIVKTPINNDDVRVLDVVVQPHEKTKMHEHKANRVMIYRTAGAQNFEYSDGRHTVLKFRENEVKWSPIEGMHIAEVATERPVGIVEIELKKPGAGKKITTDLDPLKVDPKHYKLEFENDQVRVFRVKYGPHEAAPMHEHQLNRINLYLTDAKVQVTYADGRTELIPHKAGEIVQGGPSKHREQNTSDQPVEVLVTELKF